MLTSGIISRDQVAVKRIFSLISRPLDDFNDLYYPSYAEWVSCKVYYPTQYIALSSCSLINASSSELKEIMATKPRRRFFIYA